MNILLVNLSPLTHGNKEANAGGMAGDSLAALGDRALVFTGARPGEAPAIFCQDETGGRFLDARPFMGPGNEALAAALGGAYSGEYVIVGIGPAGEQQLGAAGIAVTDSHGQPFRLAARGRVGPHVG